MRDSRWAGSSRQNGEHVAEKKRRFVVWAHVSGAEHIVEMPAGATDKECEDECRNVLDTLISNGDTGWNELGVDEPEEPAPAESQ
jgi:hypothetical protein